MSAAAGPTVRLTHLGLFVHDRTRMASFYTSMFGMVVTDEGEFRGKRLTFLTGTPDEHHQIVLVEGRTGDSETKILSQVSFRVESLADLRRLAAMALELGGTELEARNHGNSWSIYFRDPEHNMIEMYVTTPWQVRQPWRVALDLEQSDGEIVAETQRLIADDGVLIDLTGWEHDVETRLRRARGGQGGGDGGVQ